LKFRIELFVDNGHFDFMFHLQESSSLCDCYFLSNSMPTFSAMKVGQESAAVARR